MTRPQFSPRTHRARILLDQWSAEHAGIWSVVDRAREARNWPDYVYLPMERAGRIMAEHMVAHGQRPRMAVDLVAPASYLTLFGAWRLTQGIYRYDPSLRAALVDTPIDGEIPADVLRRMPAWCVYIETPDMTAPLVGGGTVRLHGTWAWIDRVESEARDVLTLGLDTDAHLAIGHIPLGGTLTQALDRVEADWRDAVARGNAQTAPPEGYAAAARATFAPILSLLLYLCADEADYTRPQWPRSKRTKQGWRMFAADKLVVWDVGVRIGAALRRAYQDAETEQHELLASGRARPRAHIRRAHWHGYWSGPRDGERRFDVRWMPPLPINMRDGDLPATIHEVKP